MPLRGWRRSPGGDALGPPVVYEVCKVATVRFDGVVGQKRVSDPGDQRPGGGQCVAFEEIAALGDKESARWRGRRSGREAGVGVVSGGLSKRTTNARWKVGT